MTYCPHCGEEIKEDTSYCPKCGELLNTEQVERTSLSEYLKHSFDVLKKNPSTFIPKFILALASAISGLLYTKLYGVEFSDEIQEAILSGGDLSPYYPLFKVGAAFIVVGIAFDLLFQPFLQHLYLDVTRGDPVDFGKVYSDTMNRLGEYIVAQLAVFSIPVVLFLGLFGLLNMGTVDEIPGIYGGGFLVFILALILMYFLSLGTQIMVWEGEGFSASVKLGLNFFQRRLGMLIVLGIIELIISMVFQYLPYSNYYMFIVDIFVNVIVIDMYLNYRKMRK